MATYHFSGIDRKEFIELLAREGAAGMVLWRYASQPAITTTLARYPEVRIVIDSGFKEKPTNEQYINLIATLGDRPEWYGNNDVIGNQEESDNNYRAITAALPATLARRVLWIYQAGSIDYLVRQAESHQFIGIGGLVPRIKTNVQQAMDYIGGLGRVLDRAGAKAHLFGVGTPDILLAFRSEKWFESADSQSWISGYKALELIRNDGSRVSSTAAGFLFEKAECAIETTAHREEIYRQLKEAGYVWSSEKADWTKEYEIRQAGKFNRNG